jgi:hypothetical protein
MGDIDNQAKEKPGFDINKAKVVDSFRKHRDNFLIDFHHDFKAGKVEEMGIIKYFNNWAYNNKLSWLERRWVRIEVSKALMLWRQEIYINYGRQLKLRPARIDRVRYNKTNNSLGGK